MPAPIHRLKKSEIQWLSNHTCKAHRHNFLDHYACYLAEQPNSERVGFLDIETSHLKGDIGIILSWAIKSAGDGPTESSVISRRDIAKAKPGREDEKVVRKLVEAMGRFDILVTYYGTGFDLKFIRTRAVMLGIPYPSFGSLKHRDAYYMVRGRFALLSNRLKHAAKALLGKTDKTEIDWATWRAAARGEAKALEYVLDHNIKDVEDLERLYNVVKDYSKKNDKSF